jgi:type IV pilus assembly protein PilB
MSALPRSSELARARGLADRAGMPWVDLDSEAVDPLAVSSLPIALMAELLAVPYALEGNRLKVAIADPDVLVRVDAALALPADYSIASRAAVSNLVESLRQGARRTGSLLAFENMSGDGEADQIEALFLTRAAEAGATDLHFVPCREGLRVRARIDGVLREIGQIDKGLASAAMSRLLVEARLDISDHRRVQEGRLSVTTASGRTFDVRATVLPTVAGGGAVLRLLERAVEPPSLTQIGLSDDVQLALERILNARRGALLVTGPTGSGKSTTIYAALADMANAELNIVMVEDPVEYRLDGVYQLEVDPHADLTFDSALRAFLRSDPDVISIGEMRDPITASAALKAALTGAFVISTLHTRDAPSTATRLLEMGVEPYITAATVTAVLAQRLARRLCAHCRQPYTPTEIEVEELGLDEDDVLFHAGGCSLCDHGYRGQIGVHQLMLFDDDIAKLVLERASYEEIAAAATANGMATLADDGLKKALVGLTSVEELRRVTADVS